MKGEVFMKQHRLVRFMALICCGLSACLLFSGCERKPENPAYIYQTIVWPSSEPIAMSYVTDIVVGTIGEKYEKKLSFPSNVEWTTISGLTVEETLYGDLRTGDKIEVVQRGAKDWELYESVDTTGSFYQEGEKLLLLLVKEKDDNVAVQNSRTKKVYGAVHFVGARTVDADGNLGYRYDPFERYYTLYDPPFYEYKTLQQFKDALPQILRDYEQWAEERGLSTSSQATSD